MKKQVNKESLERMITLQKGYIDDGDQKNAGSIEQLEKQVAHQSQILDFLTGNMSVVGRFPKPDSTDYVAEEVLGDAQALLKVWVPVLIDTTDNINIRTKVRRLSRNNYFRFEDGSYAPVVGITQEMYDECMNNDIYIATSEPGSGDDFIAMVDEEGIHYTGTDGPGTDESMSYPYLYPRCLYPKGTWDAAKEWEKQRPIWGGNMPDQGMLVTSTYEDNMFDIFENGTTEGGVYFRKFVREDGSIYYKPLTHYLRPWETTETKYTIGIANLVDLYLLDNWTLNDKDNPLYDEYLNPSKGVYKGVFLNNPLYMGKDFSKWKLPPTAISPGPITTIQDGNLIKARNFFYLYQGIANCRSDKGLLAENPLYEADRTYPRTNDVNQVNNMRYARNNNANVNAPYPFAEGGYFAWNVFITALELAAKTRFIHAANLFGSGISSNDGTTEANFFTSGGIRFRTIGTGPDGSDGNWNYKAWNSNSSPLQYNAQGGITDMSNLLSQYWPKEQCMEAQLAASMAVELGIQPTTEDDMGNYSPIWGYKQFSFYGGLYYYMNVPGFDGLLEGSMNTRIYKFYNPGLDKPIHAYQGGQAQDWMLQIIQRMSLFNGVNLCGDVWAYNGGGLEMVGTPKEGATAGSTGNKIDIYVEPDQTKWHSETAITKPAGTRFDFEDAYELVLSATNLGDSYTLTRGAYTPWKIAKASSMAQGECYYQWDNAYWISGTNRVRVMSLFRCGSSDANCSPRDLYANYAASTTYRNDSGSAQTLVEFV